jgi:hypothetical protein
MKMRSKSGSSIINLVDETLLHSRQVILGGFDIIWRKKNHIDQKKKVVKMSPLKLMKK